MVMVAVVGIGCNNRAPIRIIQEGEGREMTMQRVVKWDWLTKESTTAVSRCEDIGHCYHEGTARGVYYCCRCGGKRPLSIAERLNFYEN